MNRTEPARIEVSAASVCKPWSQFRYVNSIFDFFQEHKELLDSPDYKRLYYEAKDYLFRHAVRESGWNENDREFADEALEFLSDITRNLESRKRYKLSAEQVNSFLELRREVWRER